ncbi:MAG: N-acetyl-gamma-glutamyl-phosphate reductase [Clostridia bacterium]|nr:N-acetyl-gamma-glutamyl-phosphate reductase [Clostridia bacterium]
MIRAGVLGGTGYAGIEVVRLLLRHPEAEITRIVSQSYAGQKIAEVYPSLMGVCDVVCSALDVDDIAANCDVVFTALPHGASKEVIPSLYEKGLKVIDLSGDFRYNDPAVYEKWYGESHSNPELLQESVYGLCELHREEVKQARLIGNPGCYTTCSITALAPLVKAGIADNTSLIIDAKSGVTGAGRGLALPNLFCECTETMKAYKVATHRHTSEIEQELSLLAGEDIMLSFTPHLAPMKRGILATCYANLKDKHTAEELVDLYKDFYAGDPFIRIYPAGTLPEVKHVAGSNYIGIGLVVDERLNRVVVVSCIDNLIKGAAGQAVQNMNLLFGLPEDTALADPGMYL